MKRMICVLSLALVLTACAEGTTKEAATQAQNAARNVQDQIQSAIQSDEPHVQMVKNGYPQAYPGCTYGEVYDSFFSSPTWTYFEGKDDDGKDVDVVEFTGYCMYQDVEVKARQQFLLDTEARTFSTGALSFNDVPQSVLMSIGLVEAAFSDYAETHNIKLDEATLEEELGELFSEENGSGAGGAEQTQTDMYGSSSFPIGSSSIDWDSLSSDEIGQGVLDSKLSADGYILPTADSEYLVASPFYAFSDEDLRLAVNEIYARRGRRFNSADLQEYFNQKTWYKGTIAPEAFDESVFNEYEKANVALLGSLQEERKSGGSTAGMQSPFEQNYIYGSYYWDDDGREFFLDITWDGDSDLAVFSGFHTEERYIRLEQVDAHNWRGISEDTDLYYNGVDRVTMIFDGGVTMDLMKVQDHPRNVG